VIASFPTKASLARLNPRRKRSIIRFIAKRSYLCGA